MGLLPMFARPEANRHQRQIASTGPAWGQRTDILIVVNGMVLSARYVALFFYLSFLLIWSILFLLSFLLPILAVSGMPPVISLLFVFLLSLYTCWFVSLWLHSTHGVSFLADSLKKLSLLTGFWAISHEFAQAGNITHLPFLPCISISSPSHISNSLTLL